MPKIAFTIYVSGSTARSSNTVSFFKKHITGLVNKEDYKVAVVDITVKPHLAEKIKVLATPTIVRQFPMPDRRIIGELKDGEKASLAFKFLTDDLNNNGKI